MKRLSCGIVGLPNVGKSTLFNALTAQSVPASNFPFCTIDPNVGVVEVPDPRIPVLAKLSHSAKEVYAPMEFVDIAGLISGASQGEGLGNMFLAHIQEVDLILHVVRCFEAPAITHVMGTVDPVRDVGIIHLELILSDLGRVTSILAKMEKLARTKKELHPLITLLKRIEAHLNTNQPVRTLSFTAEEKEWLKPYPFLTAKPVLYVANVSEDAMQGNGYTEALRHLAEQEQNECLILSSKIEEELHQLSSEERLIFLEAWKMKEPGLQRLIRASFHRLGWISFLTTGSWKQLSLLYAKTE